MATAVVHASGFISAQMRAASLVQALIEAETAAARLSKAQSESSGDEESWALMYDGGDKGGFFIEKITHCLRWSIDGDKYLVDLLHTFSEET